MCFLFFWKSKFDPHPSHFSSSHYDWVAAGFLSHKVENEVWAHFLRLEEEEARGSFLKNKDKTGLSPFPALPQNTERKVIFC